MFKTKQDKIEIFNRHLEISALFYYMLFHKCPLGGTKGLNIYILSPSSSLFPSCFVSVHRSISVDRTKSDISLLITVQSDIIIHVFSTSYEQQIKTNYRVNIATSHFIFLIFAHTHSKQRALQSTQMNIL